MPASTWKILTLKLFALRPNCSLLARSNIRVVLQHPGQVLIVSLKPSLFLWGRLFPSLNWGHFLWSESCMEEIPCRLRHCSVFSLSIESTVTLLHSFWNSSSTENWQLLSLKKRIFFLSGWFTNNMWSPKGLTAFWELDSPSSMSSKRIPPKPHWSCWSKSLSRAFLSFKLYLGRVLNATLGNLIFNLRESRSCCRF